MSAERVPAPREVCGCGCGFPVGRFTFRGADRFASPECVRRARKAEREAAKTIRVLEAERSLEDDNARRNRAALQLVRSKPGLSRSKPGRRGEGDEPADQPGRPSLAAVRARLFRDRSEREVAIEDEDAPEE